MPSRMTEQKGLDNHLLLHKEPGLKLDPGKCFGDLFVDQSTRVQ
jgi:hypothetical protein